MPTVWNTIDSLLQRRWFNLLLIIVLGGAAYANTLQVPFILDDHDVIVRNPYLDSLEQFFSREQWSQASFRARWLAMFSFALNRMFGGISLPGYHLVNIAIHLGCGLLVLALAAATLGLFGEDARRRYRHAPLLAALLFVLHPLQTQAVTYIVQRMASLATLLYLTSLLLYIRSAAGDTGGGQPRRALCYGGALLACLLAMGSKEISITLPAMLLLYDLLFLPGRLRTRLLRLAPFLLCTAYLPFIVYGMGGGTSLAGLSASGSTVMPLPHLTYLITELRVMLTYLRLLLLPLDQNLNYDYPVYHSLLEPTVFCSALVLAGLAGLALRLIMTGRGRPAIDAALPRICGFAILWFFITISVESGVIPLLDVIFEHRLYLPSVWPAIACAVCLIEVRQRVHTRRLLVTAAIVLLLLTLAVATFRRNHVWGNEATLWGDVVAKAPGHERGWASLGLYYARQLQPRTAIPLLERALAIKPDMYQPLYALGVACFQTGDTRRAAGLFVRTTQVAPQYADAWKMAGSMYLELGDAALAQFYLLRAEELAPDDRDTRGLLGRARARLTHQLSATPSAGR